MTKYVSYEDRTRVQRPWKVHPVWRGIGCILMVLVPLLAYSGAVLLKEANIQNRWMSVPPDLDQYINTARLETLLPGFAPVWDLVGRIYLLDLVLTATLTILGFGLLTIFNGMLYGMLGPSRYGPLDSPEIKRSPRKKKRYK